MISNTHNLAYNPFSQIDMSQADVVTILHHTVEHRSYPAYNVQTFVLVG